MNQDAQRNTDPSGDTAPDTVPMGQSAPDYAEVYRQRYETFRHLDRLRWQMLQIAVGIGSVVLAFGGDAARSAVVGCGCRRCPSAYLRSCDGEDTRRHRQERCGLEEGWCADWRSPNPRHEWEVVRVVVLDRASTDWCWSWLLLVVGLLAMTM